MFELFHYQFMQRAFIAGGLIAVIAPLIGTFLVIRRLSLFADTLSHIALTGVAIGLILGIQPLVITVLLTSVSSVLIDRLRTSGKIPGDAVLAMFLPSGLAFSIILFSLANGFNSNLFAYLFGSITTVLPSEILIVFGLAIVSLILITYYYRSLLFCALDEETARVSGIPVKLVNSILMILTAVTVSLSMRIVGSLLVGALMVIPAISAMQIARSFKQTLLFSIVLAEISVMSGLILAYKLNLPAGGTIVIVSLGIFSVIFLWRRIQGYLNSSP